MVQAPALEHATPYLVPVSPKCFPESTRVGKCAGNTSTSSKCIFIYIPGEIPAILKGKGLTYKVQKEIGNC